MATYSVKATGASGAIATTSFTDGNVKAGSSGLSGTETWKLTKTTYSTNNCSTPVADPTATVVVKAGSEENVQAPNGTSSASLQASDDSFTNNQANVTTGKKFQNWTAGDSQTTFTVTPNTGGREICVTGTGQGSKSVIANYAAPANTSLTVAAATGTYGGTTTLSATLKKTSDSSGVSGKTINFSLNGNSVGTATTNGSGVATLSNVSLSGINAGSYPSGVGASFAGDNAFNASSGSGSLTVNQAQATLSFANGTLSRTYDGNAKPVTVDTSPTGLSGVDVKYFNKNTDGSKGSQVSGAPTNAGSYIVEASLTNNNYTAQAISGTLVIAKAQASITLNQADLTQTYDGNAKSVGYTTTPQNLNGVTVSYSQNGNTVTNPTNAGSYDVKATLTNDNYEASDATDTLVIAKAQATLSFDNATLTQTFNGNAKSVTVNTSPGGLTGVTISYSQNGSPVTNPTNTGSYDVKATLTNPNYNAQAINGTLVISKATATLTLGQLNPTYDGNAKSVSVTTNPSNLQALTVTYDNSATAPTNAGSYQVVATLNNANYEGSAQGTLNIAKRPITVTADPQTKILGAAAEPQLTYKASEQLISGNTFTGGLTRDPGETIGTYAIKQGTLTAGGNYAITYVGANLNIVYAYSGFLQPINDTAHQTGVTQSKFKLGQTIPVKFIISNAAGTAVQQTPNPTFTKSARLGACDPSTTLESAVTLSPDTDGTYDFSGGQYHYNWSTKSITQAGEYRIYANLADGTKRWVDICLTK